MTCFTQEVKYTPLMDYIQLVGGSVSMFIGLVMIYLDEPNNVNSSWYKRYFSISGLGTVKLRISAVSDV
jgi:hypothetical protein